MDQKSLWNDVLALPPTARQQVADFVAFLRTRYAVQAQRTTRAGSLEDEPFVGIWSDRSDMADSAAWTRSLRTDEWQRGRE